MLCISLVIVGICLCVYLFLWLLCSNKFPIMHLADMLLKCLLVFTIYFLRTPDHFICRKLIFWVLLVVPLYYNLTCFSGQISYSFNFLFKFSLIYLINTFLNDKRWHPSCSSTPEPMHSQRNVLFARVHPASPCKYFYSFLV